MNKTKNLLVQNQTIQVKHVSENSYLSLTDIARAKNPMNLRMLSKTGCVPDKLLSF
jgi:hypothetical protein